MKRFAILDKQLYELSLPEPDMMCLETQSWKKDYEMWVDKTYNATANHFNMDIVIHDHPVSLKSNTACVDEIIDAIYDNDLRDIYNATPMVRVEVEYVVTDKEGNELENNHKVRVCELSEVITPSPITWDNEFLYDRMISLKSKVNIALERNFGLGISRTYSPGEWTLTIKNIKVRMAVTSEKIYQQLLTQAQKNVSWKLDSQTQSQVDEHDVYIFDLEKSMVESTPITVSMDNRYTTVDVNITLFTQLFAYVNNHNTDVEDTIKDSIKKGVKYGIYTRFVGDAESQGTIDKPVVTGIEYGESRAIAITPKGDVTIKALKIKRSDALGNVAQDTLEFDTDNKGVTSELTTPDGKLFQTSITIYDDDGNPAGIIKESVPTGVSAALRKDGSACVIDIDSVEGDYIIYIITSQTSTDTPDTPDEPPQDEDCDCGCGCSDVSEEDLHKMFDQNTKDIG